MNTPLDTRLKLLIRDLLNLPESQIKSGRDNEIQEDFNTDYVVVDDLGGSIKVASNISYNGDTEVQQITNNYTTIITIDFYGENAYNKCNDFILLARSQKAYELKRELKIELYQNSTIQDLKKLTGQQYGNRYQATFKVHDFRSIDIDVLRIDEAQTTFITN